MYIGAATVENSMEVHQKTNIELPCDPVIPLLGIYPEKTLIQKDTSAPMFTAALFAVSKTWKQPKRPSTDKWKEDVVHMYNGILLSIKK